MPRIIFKCPYIRGGVRNTTRLSNYVRYVSTREGVEMVGPDTGNLSATKNQRALVRQLAKDFPQSKSSFEYEDFRAAPTRARASEYISRTMEDNAHQLERREIYVRYISERPRVQRVGSHGLFTGSQDTVVLSRVMEEVANHPGNVWTPIISLRREDAARLGYDNAESWRSLLTSFAPEIAKGMKIPLEQFRWYAAYHDEGSHPHVHMVCYSADPKKGFLTKDGLDAIRSKLANQIFRQELLGVYQKQTQRRDELSAAARETLEQLIGQIQTGAVENETVGQLLERLSHRLQNTKGKKQYGYLSPAIKAQVDELVDELAKDPKVAKAYDLWYELREDVLRTYKDEMPERLPLSRQKEFKSIKNIVIREAVQLGELASIFCEDAVEDEPEPADMEQEPPDEYAALDAIEPYVDWSDQYKQALAFLYGDDKHPQDFEQAFRLLQKEATSGNALAMHDLGRMAADGLGCDADPEQSRQWYAKAFTVFLAAEEKNPGRYLEYRIGKMYAAGLGIEQDYSVAAMWLGKAAAQNHKYALYTLAGLYQRGKGVVQDYETAYSLYARSESLGFPYAAYELGKMHRDGIGCEKDAEKSSSYFRYALSGFLVMERDRSDDKLQFRIGKMLLDGLETEQDEQVAQEWFEKAAKQGNPNAQYQLARLMLGDALASPEKLKTALEWLQKAAGAGSEHAQYALGKLYRDGTGTEQDLPQAAAWFWKAAEQGNSYAAYALGKLLLEGGEGLPKNVPEAAVWFQKAAEDGNLYAQYRLGKLLLLGDDVPKDVERALRLLTASAEQGNQYAQYALGKLFFMGKEIPKDREAAVRWFTLSAEQGNTHALYFLQHMDDWRRAAISQGLGRLLHHLGNLFRAQTPPAAPNAPRIADKKLLRKIREKQAALGIKSGGQQQQY